MKFFLRGVAETAAQATDTAQRIFELREAHRARVVESNVGTNGLRLLALLYESPIVNARFVERRLSVAFATASKLLGRFEELGLIRELTGQRRSRRFRYDPYLALFRPAMAGAAQPPPPEVTTSVGR
jgi:Fic family protein